MTFGRNNSVKIKPTIKMALLEDKRAEAETTTWSRQEDGMLDFHYPPASPVHMIL